MARPPKDLTERELEIMHAAWTIGEAGVAEIKEELAQRGLVRAYTTIATLVRILETKGYLKQVNTERPFRYRPDRSFEDVSSRLVDQLIDRVFGGSRTQFLVHLMDRTRLTADERVILERLLDEGGQR